MFTEGLVQFLLKQAEDAQDSDLAVIGIPCPLFSVLNQRKRTVEHYNPFTETLGTVLPQRVGPGVEVHKPQTFDLDSPLTTLVVSILQAEGFRLRLKLKTCRAQ